MCLIFNELQSDCGFDSRSNAATPASPSLVKPVVFFFFLWQPHFNGIIYIMEKKIICLFLPNEKLDLI